MESKLLLFLNLALCLFGTWVCICRIGAMTGASTKRTIRIQYVMWLTLLLMSGLSFLWGHRVTKVEIVFAMGVVSHLLIGFSVWRHGPPAYASKAHRVHS